MYMDTNGMGAIGLGETTTDWSGILKDIAGAGAAFYSAKTASDIAKMQAKAQTQNPFASYLPSTAGPYNTQVMPQYSPTYGAPSQSSNLMPILLLGGAALVIFYLMKD